MAKALAVVAELRPYGHNTQLPFVKEGISRVYFVILGNKNLENAVKVKLLKW